MIPFKRVPSKDAEKYIQMLKDNGELIRGYRIKREGDYVLIPCTSGDELGDFESTVIRRMEQVGSYERIADFYVVKEREGWERIADEIIRKQNPRAIFLDRGVVGNERKRNVTRIYGTGPPEGIHRENGIRLLVNIEKAYFSPRLGGIRERLLSNVLEYKHEKVVDMYSGIGPISIILLKRGVKTFSFDINPFAVELLKHNFELNRVKGNYAVTDSNAISSCFTKADQIIMNNPTQPPDISFNIIGAFSSNTLIHYFLIDKKESSLNFNKVEIIERREVHGYSPSSSLFYYLLRKI